MAGIKVDPPPVNMQIIDMKTGRPTRPFIEFMHRLWQRTGGEVDAIEDLDVTNSYPVFKPTSASDAEMGQPSFLEGQKGASEEQINEAIQNLSALVHAKAPQPDVLDAIESLRAVTLSDMAGLHSEIGELREHVESLITLVMIIERPGRAASDAVSNHVALPDPHSQYADQANTYTETEVDNLLDDKADKATTYTETEVDLLLDDKAAIAGQTFTGDIAAPKITASTGVLFGTDTAAANTLDDYEEGTWDIGLTIDGGQGSAKSGNLGCFYTKVGNSVTISGIVRKGSFASATGVVSFNGTLPFTAAYGFIIKCSTRALTGLEDGHIKAKDGTVALYSRVSNDNHDTPDTGNEVNTTDARTTKVIEFSAVYLTT